MKVKICLTMLLALASVMCWADDGQHEMIQHRQERFFKIMVDGAPYFFTVHERGKWTENLSEKGELISVEEWNQVLKRSKPITLADDDAEVVKMVELMRQVMNAERNQEVEAPKNVVSEQWVENGTRRIYGITSTPPTEGQHGIAIISHGFNGTHHFGRDYFSLLNELGYVVYTFDYPCGSVRSQSDNNTMNMSVSDQKEDLKAIVHHFRQQPDIDGDKIVLIGESQGGLVSALTAAEIPEQVSRLVLVYPALCIPDNWNQRYPTVQSIPEVTEMWGVKLGRKFFLDCKKIDVWKSITRYQGPVQIIHGSKDAVVPLSYSERAMKQYKDAHLGVIPGAGHGFNPEQRQVCLQFVREFLEK